MSVDIYGSYLHVVILVIGILQENSIPQVFI